MEFLCGNNFLRKKICLIIMSIVHCTIKYSALSTMYKIYNGLKATFYRHITDAS